MGGNVICHWTQCNQAGTIKERIRYHYHRGGGLHRFGYRGQGGRRNPGAIRSCRCLVEKCWNPRGCANPTSKQGYDRIYSVNYLSHFLFDGEVGTQPPKGRKPHCGSNECLFPLGGRLGQSRSRNQWISATRQSTRRQRRNFPNPTRIWRHKVGDDLSCESLEAKESSLGKG